MNLNIDLFDIWFQFYLKWNKCIVVWNKQEWVFILDLEYDPEFSWVENPIYFISFNSIEEDILSFWEIDLTLFTADSPEAYIQDQL